MRMLGRLETIGGCTRTTKHIPGAQNVSADGISRWPQDEIIRKVGELNNSDDWLELPIGKHLEGIFSLVVKSTCNVNEHGQLLWTFMANPRGRA